MSSVTASSFSDYNGFRGLDFNIKPVLPERVGMMGFWNIEVLLVCRTHRQGDFELTFVACYMTPKTKDVFLLQQVRFTRKAVLKSETERIDFCMSILRDYLSQPIAG